MTTATITKSIENIEQFSVKSRGSSTTITTHSVTAGVDLGDEHKVTIFGTTYALDYIEIQKSWTSNQKSPFAEDALVIVTFYTILSNGKKGTKYGRREFDLKSLREYTDLPATAISALANAFTAEVSNILKAGN
jgi:hypothetical protein